MHRQGEGEAGFSEAEEGRRGVEGGVEMAAEWQGGDGWSGTHGEGFQVDNNEAVPREISGVAVGGEDCAVQGNGSIVDRPLGE
jgi:hypothetical protein